MVSWVEIDIFGTRNPEFLASLRDNYILAVEFKPEPQSRFDYITYIVDYDALGRVRVGDNEVIGGPLIKIYQKKTVT